MAGEAVTNELRYREYGSGPAVLLVHGGGADGDLWSSADIDDLGRDHRVIAYNRRGYTGSGLPVSDWARHRDDAAALLEALDAAPATVLGYSAGSIVALELTVHRPELVAALVLIDPAVYIRKHVTPGLARTFVVAQLTKRLRGPERGAEVFMRYVTSYATGGSAWDRPDFPEERRAAMRANGRALFADFAAGDGSQITSEQVQAISCPVTLAVNELSPSFLQKTARGLHQMLPEQHRIETIVGAGHALNFDKPGELARVVRQTFAASAYSNEE